VASPRSSATGSGSTTTLTGTRTGPSAALEVTTSVSSVVPTGRPVRSTAAVTAAEAPVARSPDAGSIVSRPETLATDQVSAPRPTFSTVNVRESSSPENASAAGVTATLGSASTTAVTDTSPGPPSERSSTAPW
jgi:hypothetical protein